MKESLSDELLQKVQKLEIQLHKLVRSVFSGEYHSAFKGQGMTFSEFREYVPGDDVRAISWPLTARTSIPYIKLFEEERELSMYILMDASASMMFPEREAPKHRAAIEVAALMALSAQMNRDHVGLVAVSDQLELHLKPQKTKAHVLRILRDLIELQPKHRETNLDEGFRFLLGVAKKHSVIVVISDFKTPQQFSYLQKLSSKHTVLAFVVFDELERNWPTEFGLTLWKNNETAQKSWFFPLGSSERNWQKKSHQNWREHLIQQFKKSRVPHIFLCAQDDYLEQVVQFLRRRAR